MHTGSEEPGNADEAARGGRRQAARGGPQAARTANLLGALALEAAGAQQEATVPVVGQAGAAAAALVTIAARPGRSIEQLRAPLGLSQPGAVRLVERLVGAGWVERTGPGGRRGLELRLTPEGEALLDDLLAARRAALAELLQPLSERERAQLTGLLEKLLGARTADRADLERLCRLCEWRTCRRCPVAGAVRRGGVRPSPQNHTYW
jgi:MarR family transcriptional repressor of emrRAB